ncbi:MAG: hypothetical protein C0501_17555 [Isosphaera sp.]|nr:hypothetical protein [Isosphaera sp.]
MSESRVGAVAVGRVLLYALVVHTPAGFRLRVSPDEWETLGVEMGMTVEVKLPGSDRRAYFLRAVTYAAPHWEWAEFVRAPVRAGSQVRRTWADLQEG